MIHRLCLITAACAAILFVVVPVRAQTPGSTSSTARHAMVASQEAQATRIGVDILQRGGNAVDAAVAVGFALAVTHPQAGNIGGGGFMLIHLAPSQQTIAIDYRETAPQAITRDIFLNDKGEADPSKSLFSGLGVGVPGTVAGLTLAYEKYGSHKLALSELIAPAITLAREGFLVTDALAASLARAQPLLVRWPSSAKIFLKSDGTALNRGDRLVQSDLAQTLEAIAKDGPRAFYEGAIADAIVAGIRSAHGLMTREDLQNYHAIERTPMHGTYRGYDVFSMPPPSSGGVHLIEMLNVLEGYQLDQSKPETAHLMIETMKRAYADRAEFLGDADHIKVPVERLISKDYAAILRAEIDPNRARPSLEIHARGAMPHEGNNTTHFSVVDADGNAVSNTYTLNLNYGMGLVAEGTGILLNNELDDFAAKPGAPNAFGLVGGEANAPGPGKRPLSSMTPTIVMKDNMPFLVTGSPGGSRIITTVLQVVTNVIDFHMSIADAVASPRLHHQWLPDEVVAERGVAPQTIQWLESHGHKVRRSSNWGSANSIMMTPAGLTGAADPRSADALAAGY